MEMKHDSFRSIVILIVIFLISSACTSQELDCEVTNGDVLKVVDQQSHNEIHYFLVHRISGFQDKVVSLELYDREPDFDKCNKSDYSTIFANSVDYDDRPITGLKVNITKQEFQVSYGDVGEKEGAIKLIFK